MYSPFSLLTNATDIFNLFDTKLDIVTFPILALCNKHLCDTMHIILAISYISVKS